VAVIAQKAISMKFCWGKGLKEMPPTTLLSFRITSDLHDQNALEEGQVALKKDKWP
tara:strand:- start:64 stop:231 length:168 start_codon:yes stop_codon:yes gene_type:complete